MKNIKRSFKIAILSIFVGSIQMVIFLPDGSYCDDLSSDVISGIFRFMPIQFIIMFFNSYIFKSYDKYTSLFVLLFLWLYINKIEFTNREACWATFSEREIEEYVIDHSIFPCSISLFLFFCIYWIMKKKNMINF